MCEDADIPSASRRQRPTTQPKVEKSLLVWFRQKSARPEIRLDGNMLLQQANKFRLMFSPESKDEISAAWIDRFKEAWYCEGSESWRVWRS